MGSLQENDASHSVNPRQSRIVPWSILAALALAAAAWTLFVAGRARVPNRAFESAHLGCRFTYPSRLVAGPNFVRSRTGAVLTIERHSLFEAENKFVRHLPDSLYPQVRIQLDQIFRDLEELSQEHPALGGRPALQVHLRGKPGKSSSVTDITVDIAATDAWVYVLRATIPVSDVEKDRADFESVRRTLEFFDGDAPDPDQ